MRDDQDSLLGMNLRRVMAREAIIVEQLSERTGLDARTIHAMLSGKKRPHSRTLHKLAEGLGVSPDEFFADPSLLAQRLFDRATNPVIEEVVAIHRQVFHGWSEAEFDDLYSRFGCGGAMTEEGVLGVAEQINRRRAVMEKVAVVMETSDGELLERIVEALYCRVADWCHRAS